MIPESSGAKSNLPTHFLLSPPFITNTTTITSIVAAAIDLNPGKIAKIRDTLDKS